MLQPDFNKVIIDLTNEKFSFLQHFSKSNVAMPSINKLEKIVEILKSIIFPGFFGKEEISSQTLAFHLGASLDEVFRLMEEQIYCGFCFDCGFEEGKCSTCKVDAKNIAIKFIENLSNIKEDLSTDVIAAYNGDPASKNYGETIFCYPSINAITNHRIAHALLKLKVPLIPRIISELAHSKTGIDIHPGATIGKYFFIDHGTGVVIGETSIIGENVRIYQGVTLGAKSFPLDKDGKPIKGIDRHPVVEDNVTIYANATILGRITIGKNSIVGGNTWITDNLAPETKIYK